jgi:ribosomal protein S18 acetylase RimI-like enzyme
MAFGALQIRAFLEEDTASVIGLWRGCGLTRAWNDPQQDILRKLGVQRELFLVGALDGQTVATVMAGYDGHRGWINYLAVAPEHRRRGFGRALMLEVETKLRSLGCPKINLQIRRENIATCSFYAKLGFGEDNVVSFGKRLTTDEPVR